ncbi:hypothetical protein PFY12_09970 [Chryseobacterium camelliae]|uniref:Uncharacterized protein n=1 Tax=Chryseobacterium camelliae TaxID=1265445 RepID=A0ABY7QJB2_9FLAO|nr:hypothetical protein [Chryseobacterium camelliae]WBV59383.1 hypothetical protein PFY12_09970 [Chryseobacterium camelliae]
MRTELFRNKIFFYIFLFIVGIDVAASLIQISRPAGSIGIIIFKILKLLVCLLAFVMFFIKTKLNHPVFKIYIYFVGLLFPIFLLFYGLKEFIMYGISVLRIETYFESGFAVLFAFVLLIFYNKFKIEAS